MTDNAFGRGIGEGGLWPSAGDMGKYSCKQCTLPNEYVITGFQEVGTAVRNVVLLIDRFTFQEIQEIEVQPGKLPVVRCVHGLPYVCLKLTIQA